MITTQIINQLRKPLSYVLVKEIRLTHDFILNNTYSAALILGV